VLARRLAGKSLSEMACLYWEGCKNLTHISQSKISHHFGEVIEKTTVITTRIVTLSWSLIWLLVSKVNKTKYSSFQTCLTAMRLACHMGSCSVTGHLTEVTSCLYLQPIKAGIRYSDPMDARLSWPRWLVSGYIPGWYTARRRSPIPVLTGLDIEYFVGQQATSPLHQTACACLCGLSVLPHSTLPDFYLASLPSLVRFCRAFPPLCDDAVSLLLHLGRKVHAHLSTLNASCVGQFSFTSYLFIYLFIHLMPSVLWRCWLAGRKGIRPVTNWVVGCWCGYLPGAKCRFA